MSKSFNKENLVTWNELSPSLQSRFKELEDSINSNDTSNKANGDDIRITFGYTAPKDPINNRELWVDEKYRILRAFTGDNWEFCRAAWFGGVKPDIDTNSGTIPENQYKPVPHDITYFTYDSTKSIPCSWSENELNEDGITYNSRYIFAGSKPINVHVEIDMSKVNNKTDDLGYLLAVFGKAYDKDNPSDPAYTDGGKGGVEYGKGVCWKLNSLSLKNGISSFDISDANNIPSAMRQTTASIDLHLDTGYYCLFDIDCNNHALEKIAPSDTRPSDTVDLYSATYFGDTGFPYCAQRSTMKNVEDIHNHTKYTPVNGQLSITVILTSTY